MFLPVLHLGLTLETDSSNESETVYSHFSCDEISVAGLQCLESNRLFCNCENCMIVSEDFGANLECCHAAKRETEPFLRQFATSMFFFHL